MTQPASRSTNQNELVTVRLLDERTCKLVTLIDAAKSLDNERHASIAKALDAAEKVMEHRLAGLNELRQGVITKNEFDAKYASLVSEIAAMREWRAEQAGKASTLSVLGAYAFGAVATLLAVINLLLKM